MTSGFQVVLADLRRVAGAFGTESVAFWGIMPPDGPESVSGGTPEFDGALAQVLEAIGGRHTELAAAIAYLPEITGVTTTLNQEVSQLTGSDQGWRGPAASAFSAAWRRPTTGRSRTRSRPGTRPPGG